MPYNQTLAERVREQLVPLTDVEEKEMMGGLAFMYKDKMCVGVIKDDLLCRIDPDLYKEVLEKNGCRPMDFTGRPMKGWVFVDPEAIRSRTELEYWIKMALDYNSKARSSKVKKDNT
ncbi:TfoX/Sxy family protein [Telluribacter sp.]|jgi:TfoX/Sxy family transcriptional regulator of competence genes|uniref:TfoX/Sxy family protein n=1 Tax=Telluribacter sp. TaxID=1978767 RepID=UPI002E13233A|nr:TfoX/Sxy family protein [Telluribacter sp.]